MARKRSLTVQVPALRSTPKYNTTGLDSLAAEAAAKLRENERLKSASNVKTSDDIKSELDDMLDEIDKVLEANASQFVQDYVQEGGQ